MGASKTGFYTEEQESMAVIAKALGHPARIAIIQELARNNACQCGELVLTIGLAQSTISQHLKELKNAGIIQGTLSGEKPCYCLNRDFLATFEQFIRETSRKAALSLGECC
ncbi:MAG: winged helix-turn-helix transcriptional regulator [Bacteroidetes bacterium]|nr:winged helix-turn-helix transcriptional regulator [Bacteroidota bacterium]MCH8523485.1 metalloregulator ArsR/SmtB family transcription factor [Balneolales bacterium]